MREKLFRNWLENTFKVETIDSRVSNCRRVEKFENDLDEHFNKDRLRSLSERLVYSKEDENRNLPARHPIPIEGKIITGTATLRSAVKLYRQFCEWELQGEDPHAFKNSIACNTTPRKNTVPPLKKKMTEWPSWEVPGEDDILRLAQALTPFVQFLHPDIINAITEDNELMRAEWSSKMIDAGVDPEIYLWVNSPCGFPGIRRHAGSQEIAEFRGKAAIKNKALYQALRLDDNDAPKHLWSFIFRGKKFQKFGPPGYSLAHLADHKDYNNRTSDEFPSISGSQDPPKHFFGLYSSPANTVFIPNNYLKPTDTNYTIRWILQQRAESLYGKICTLVPPPLQLKKPDEATEWNSEKFKWSEPVGNMDNVSEFLTFRRDLLNKLLKNNESIGEAKS